MKAFTFIHSYICGIQVGIQAGHSIVELMRKEEGDNTVREWADHHKTFVWLDGGDSENLNDAINIMQESGMPYAYFNEPALKYSSTDDGIITAATVVASSEMVYYSDLIRQDRLEYREYAARSGFYDKDDEFVFGNEFTVEEMRLINLIANARSKSV